METIKKYWLIKTGLIALIPLLLVSAFNYFMDPLWCFDISHKYNQFQVDIDERKQKTNYVMFRDFNYRGLLIGSSRCAFIPQNSFKGLPVYNYSVNGINIGEISTFTDYAKKRNGRCFDYIFLGLDFENASTYDVNPAIKAATEKNITESGSLFYRIKTLVSIDTAKYSYKNLQNFRKRPWRYYDRNNIQHVKKHTREELIGIYTVHFNQYMDKQSRYRMFVYNDSYRKILEQYKKENPRSIFVVFIAPTVTPFMEMIVAFGLLDDYFRWISDILDVFGEIYFFMYPNEVTNNYFDNFFDPIHARPEIGNLMVDAIYNNRIRGDSKFGMLVTRSNFQEKRALLERLMKNAHDTQFGPLIRK